MSSLEQLRALAHPVRLRLLSLLTGTAMSAAEAGRELDLSQAGVSYHLRVLERAGLVHVVEVVRLRGGQAKRYRHDSSARPFQVDDAHTPGPIGEGADERAAYVEALAAELVRRSQQRAPGLQTSTDAEVWVDAQTWRHVVALVGQASAMLHERARPPRAPGTSPVSMTAALFPVRRS
ncbi:helix-turn-helix transcriptional regulator [Kineosporia sp. J2-2]|uniref:Helix-turn-helix transcriptional regulator n=1 Tax=Kineosporia corallincola TaxID=2835133 RepID=A0ABS5TBA5_9ACTN|nr:helix-turn-helix domain-containing protein [Kineosporia corallincola]MBT0768346.1 helix-turn-helix transcriptional regulator [Kineosporia corallincola]